MNLLDKKVLVVSHDAGGAEVLSHFIKCELNLEKLTFLLSGPAVDIFHKNLGVHKNSKTLEMDLKKNEILITSTSWESDIEYEALKLAVKYQIDTYTMLDHWVNFKSRLVRNDIEILPNHFIVLDKYAMTLAHETWPNLKIVEKPNYYLIDQQSKYNEKIVTKSSKKCDDSILYLWDPSLKHKSKLGLVNEITNNSKFYDERDAFSLFISKVATIPGDSSKIRVRFHPSMTKDDKEEACNYIGRSFEISTSELIDDLLDCISVVGCNSMAMAIALSVGKKVFSSLPNSSFSILLPFEDIVPLHLI